MATHSPYALQQFRKLFCCRDLVMPLGWAAFKLRHAVALDCVADDHERPIATGCRTHSADSIMVMTVDPRDKPAEGVELLAERRVQADTVDPVWAVAVRVHEQS